MRPLSFGERLLLASELEVAMTPCRICIPIAALAALAGCSSYDPYYSSTPNPNPPQPLAVVPAAPVVAAPASSAASPRLGTGIVEGVALVAAPQPGERASASTGGSIPRHAAYRLTVRMDDGTHQVLDQDRHDFQVGDRVRVTGSGRVVRL
jgi:hypothetical protein